MVAFLRKLPTTTANEYGQWAGDGAAQDSAMEDLLVPGHLPRLVRESCARCYGSDGLGRGQGAFPRLARQKAEYLLGSLQAYAQGERHSGIMEPIAAGLDRETLRELSNYYSQMPRRAGGRAENAEGAGAIERGKAIALSGIPRQGVPACLECHSHDPPLRNPRYPLLAGQDSEYLLLRLQLFQKQQRGGTAYAHLMQFVASRGTAEQMREVALYWASAAGQDDHTGARHK